MTLPSLQKHSAREIEGILANLTLGLLPDPGIEDTHSDLSDGQRQQLLDEIRVGLGLKRDDNSPRAMSKIYEYLAHEITRAAFQGVDQQQIKSRLGAEGALAPSLYKIEFTDQFQRAKKRGINERDVELVVHSPDRLQHVIADEGSAVAISLYLREFRNTSRPSNTFSLLVVCRREGSVQKVIDGWRIYHSDVDLSRARGPLDALKSFVSVYGIHFRIGGRPGLFFWREFVPISPGMQITKMIEMPEKLGASYAVCVIPGKVSNGQIEIVLAFAINDTEYDNALRQHGIQKK